MTQACRVSFRERIETLVSSRVGCRDQGDERKTTVSRVGRGTRVALGVLALLPMAAQASFGGAPCGSDFGCHFTTWGLLLGTVGVPATCAAFGVLHAFFCHPGRSRMKQLIIGAIVGFISYEIAAIVGALVGTMGRDAPFGMLPTLGVLAVLSVLYARSAPPQHQQHP